MRRNRFPGTAHANLVKLCGVFVQAVKPIESQFIKEYVTLIKDSVPSIDRFGRKIRVEVIADNIIVIAFNKLDFDDDQVRNSLDSVYR